MVHYVPFVTSRRPDRIKLTGPPRRFLDAGGDERVGAAKTDGASMTAEPPMKVGEAQLMLNVSRGWLTTPPRPAASRT